MFGTLIKLIGQLLVNWWLQGCYTSGGAVYYRVYMILVYLNFSFSASGKFKSTFHYKTYVLLCGFLPFQWRHDNIIQYNSTV